MSNKKSVRSNFRHAVFSRDRYQCKICGKKADPKNPEATLDAHHISDRSEMPNGGYVASNGISLCKEGDNGEMSCHMKAEQWHISGGTSWVEGMKPEDLYRLVGSTLDKAIRDSERL